MLYYHPIPSLSPTTMISSRHFLHVTYTLLLSHLSPSSIIIATAFKFSTPHSVPWVGVIDNYDISTALSNPSPQNENDTQLLIHNCFPKCPILIFKNQHHVTSKQFLDFCALFDPNVDTHSLIQNTHILHPFDRDVDAPHVATRSNEEGQVAPNFQFGPLWHMDLVGTHLCRTPNLISGLHFLKVPPPSKNPRNGGGGGGGETMFCNLDIAYDALSPSMKNMMNRLKCVYDVDVHTALNLKIDESGFRRLGPFGSKKEHEQIIQPLVQRIGDDDGGKRRNRFPNFFGRFQKDKSNDTSTTSATSPTTFNPNDRKRIFFTPVRFHKFVGWTTEASWDFMTHFFHTYVHTPQNTVCVRWEDGDLVVFNNHALIHSSTATEVYKEDKRVFRLLFLSRKMMRE